MDDLNPKKSTTPIQDMINETQKDSTVGPLIGSFIIICIIIIGGLYFLGNLVSQKTNKIVQEEIQKEIENETIIETTLQQSTSEDIDTIEADLEATDLEVLDEALKQIEAEL